MEHFAKVFESNNRQLLVKKAYNDEDCPRIALIMCFQGAEVDMGLIFPDTPAGEAARDEAFERFDDKAAYAVTERVKGCNTAMEAGIAIARGGRDDAEE